VLLKLNNCVVVHPGLKLEYFQHQEWEEELIPVAENHKSPAAESSQASEEVAVVCSDSVSHHDLIVFHATRLSLMTSLLILQNIAVDSMPPSTTNELNDYLRSPVENVTDPLKWWFDKRCTYPNLSGMARDYLSIPGKQNYHSLSCY
jgi:hypothetical protein